MNPPLTFDDALVQLKLLTSQTGNFTFTNDELTQALQTAWNDNFNAVIVWDDSLTFATTSWQYGLPLGVTVILDLYYRSSVTDNPERIDGSLYEIVDGQIQFAPASTRWLMSGMTIFVKGRNQLTVDDELPTSQLVNYVLYTAATILLEQLVLKQAFVFLRNDISMSDIVRALSTVQSAALRYKQALLREFESA